MLEMKKECLDCGRKFTDRSDDAMICFYECTYCAECARKRNGVCGNCGGDLQKRPKKPLK